MNYFLMLFRSTRGRVILSVALILIALTIYFARQHRHKNTTDPAFSRYIESYTTGVVSRQSTVRIKLAGQVQVAHAQNAELDADVFDFSPCP